MGALLKVQVLTQCVKRSHAFSWYADDCNVYVRSERAGQRVMRLFRKLYAHLRLQVNEKKSAVAPSLTRSFLGFSLWVASGRRGRTIYRELCVRGMPHETARQIAANSRRWWRNSRYLLNAACPVVWEGIGRGTPAAPIPIHAARAST